MKRNPELVVMLTYNDKTVENAIEVYESAKHTKVKYWGFKEEGLPVEQMQELVEKMKADGKTTVLEVVAYTEEACVRGAKLCAECGFDILMGTMYFDSVNEITKRHQIRYYPFVGTIEGRPSVLKGTIEGMIREAQTLMSEKGVEGFDLLGYRYTGNAAELNQKFVEQVPGKVCLAGSVSDFARLAEVKATGAWAFTIGSAFFDSKFTEGNFVEQIEAVLSYMEA